MNLLNVQFEIANKKQVSMHSEKKFLQLHEVSPCNTYIFDKGIFCYHLSFVFC